MPELCVCGHEKVCHTEPESKCDCDYSLGLCECRDYRPVLDWPDSEGWWWCSWFTTDHKAEIELVEAWKCRYDSGMCFYSDFYEETVSQEDYGRKDTSDGPARFTKLVETNPFAK